MGYEQTYSLAITSIRQIIKYIILDYPPEYKFVINGHKSVLGQLEKDFP